MRKRPYIAHRKNATRRAVAGEIGRGSHRIGKHNRKTASERLIGDETPGLAPIRRQDQNIGRGVGLRHYRLIAEAEHMERDRGSDAGVDDSGISASAGCL